MEFDTTPKAAFSFKSKSSSDSCKETTITCFTSFITTDCVNRSSNYFFLAKNLCCGIINEARYKCYKNWWLIPLRRWESFLDVKLLVIALLVTKEMMLFGLKTTFQWLYRDFKRFSKLRRGLNASTKIKKLKIAI